MKRIVTVGTTGAGKTTVGKRVAAILHLPYIELDSLYWGPEWQPKEEAFQQAVTRAVSGSRWLIDGNYSRVRDIIWPRATHIIWLNYSFPRVMYQLTRRTLMRATTGEELYSGNREDLARALFSRESILLWAIRTFHRRRRQYREAVRSGNYAHLEFIELGGPADTEAFLHRLERARS